MAWKGLEIESQLESRLLQKIEKRMVPFKTLSVLGHVSRNAVSIAAVFGYREALDLTPVKFSLVIAAYQIGQILAVALQSWIARLARTKPSLGPASALGIGVAFLATGVSSTFSQACAARAALGFSCAAFGISHTELRKQWDKPELHPPSAYVAPLANIVGLFTAGATLSSNGITNLAPVVWKRIFYFHPVLIVIFAVDAWVRLPGSPETAAWLLPSERELMQKWHIGRQVQSDAVADTDITSTDAGSPWYARRRPVLRMLYLGYCLMAVSLIKSFEMFWPLIFVSAVGVDKPDALTLLLGSIPWIIPALATLMFARCWKGLLAKPFGRVLQIMTITYLAAVTPALFGFALPYFGENKAFTVAYTCMVPILFIGDVPYTTMSGLGSAALASSIPRRIRPVVLPFLRSCSIAGCILGSFVWVVGDGLPFHTTGAVSAVGHITFATTSFQWWRDEVVQEALRQREKKSAGEGPMVMDDSEPSV